MVNLTPEIMQAIKTAIQMEEEGHAFYMKAAAETQNEMGKKMFQQLAKDELEHKQTFSAMFDKVADPATWRKLVASTRGIKELPAFRELSKEQKRSKGMADDANVLRIGMDTEDKSIKHYQKAAKETKDPQAKTIFTNIAQQEEYHYNLLQAELDSLTGTGFWFDTAEFRMDGKF